MSTSSPLHVLVAGGGVAALETVLALHALTGPRVRVELLAPGGEFVQRPSSVLSPFSGQPAPSVPLDRLPELGVTRHHGALAAVNPDGHEVRTTDGGRLTYDRLVVAPGARPVDGVPGAITFRGPISAGTVEAAIRNAPSRVLFVLPPGSGWPLPLYELALPRLVGPRIDGLPADVHGFIEIDEHARVRGVPDVFAAGDATAERIKQGGLAAQRADAAAESIAAEAGAAVTPQPFRRVLRGVVLTGEAPLYLRRDLDDDSALTRPLRGAPPGVSRAGLWWPSGKIAGRYLIGFLAKGGRPGDRLTDRPPKKLLTKEPL